MTPRLLNEIIEGLLARPEVEAAALAGSRGEGRTPEPLSDWNVFVYTSAPLSLDLRTALFQPRCVEWTPRSSYELLDAGELNDGTRFTLVYRSLPEFTARLARTVEDGLASPEATVAWDSLLTGRVLGDRGGLAALRTRFTRSYSDELKRGMTALAFSRLAGPDSLRARLKAALERADAASMLRNTSAVLDTAFELVLAANGWAHPGPTRAAAVAAQLPRKPADWASRIGAVERAQARGVLEAVDALIASLKDFLVAQGLAEGPRKKAATGAVPTVAPAAAPEVPQGPLTVYTDGGCIGNPGKGAWAYLIDDGVLREEDTAGEPQTTNNRMELQAVIEALTAISKREDRSRGIRIHTDSQYVRNGITTWIKSWAANGWKTASKEPVKNQELWVQLQKWDQLLHPEWKWVKGHAGNPNNERCDALVRRTMDQM